MAVAKVVLLERERYYSNSKGMLNLSDASEQNTVEYSRQKNLYALNRDRLHEIEIVDVPRSSLWNHFRQSSAKIDDRERYLLNSNVILVQPPRLNVLRAEEKSSAQKSGREEAKVLGPNAILPQYDLKWPPVQLDGTIKTEEGYEVMKLTNLKVPRFWKQSPTEDLNKIGRIVSGKESIFLMIASYRDWQCHETITSAYKFADHPERLFVGAVEQNAPGDLSCAYTEESCDKKPEQPICKYRNQISIYKMDASMATGPVTARHIGDRLYRGEYFVMQMDAHCSFIRHWDELIINQWRQTKNEMAVLSSYLTDVRGSLTPEGDSTRNTRPIMCNSDFEGLMPSRYLRHGSQPEDVAEIRESPQLQPFWAAGFSFSRGHFKVRVPYDAYQPMVFQVRFSGD